MRNNFKKFLIISSLTTSIAMPICLASSLTTNTKNNELLKKENIDNPNISMSDLKQEKSITSDPNTPGYLSGKYNMDSNENTLTVKRENNNSFSYLNNPDRGSQAKGIASPHGILLPGYDNGGILSLLNPATGKIVKTITETLADHWLDGFWNERHQVFLIMFDDPSNNNLVFKLLDKNLRVINTRNVTTEYNSASKTKYMMTQNISDTSSAMVQNRNYVNTVKRADTTYRLTFDSQKINAPTKISYREDDQQNHRIISSFSDYIGSRNYKVDLTIYDSNKYWLRFWRDTTVKDVNLLQTFEGMSNEKLKLFPEHMAVSFNEEGADSAIYNIAVPLQTAENQWKMVVGSYTISSNNYEGSIIDFETDKINVDFDKMYTTRVGKNSDFLLYTNYAKFNNREYGKGILHFKLHEMGFSFKKESSWIWTGNNATSSYVKFYPFDPGNAEVAPYVYQGNIVGVKRDDTENNMYFINPNGDSKKGSFAYATTLASEIFLSGITNIDASTVTTSTIGKYLTETELKKNTNGAITNNLGYSVTIIPSPQGELSKGIANARVTINNGWNDGKKETKTVDIKLRGFKGSTYVPPTDNNNPNQDNSNNPSKESFFDKMPSWIWYLIIALVAIIIIAIILLIVFKIKKKRRNKKNQKLAAKQSGHALEYNNQQNPRNMGSRNQGPNRQNSRTTQYTTTQRSAMASRMPSGSSRGRSTMAGPGRSGPPRRR